MPSKKLIFVTDFRRFLQGKVKNYAHGSIQRNMLYAVMQWLDQQPRQDAIKVVRCKDCRYFEYGDYCSHDKMEQDFCREDDYCSYGERREVGSSDE